MTVDPFAQAAAEIDDNPFSDPTRGGDYPKLGELLHKLLILVPVLFEKDVPNKETGEKKDRWSLDTIVISSDGSAETYDSMYWSQKGIMTAAHKAHKNGRPVLGTLHMFPVMGTEKKLPTEEALLGDDAIKSWLARGEGMPPYKIAWGLEPATDAQKALAIKWWNDNKTPFGK